MNQFRSLLLLDTSTSLDHHHQVQDQEWPSLKGVKIQSKWKHVKIEMENYQILIQAKLLH